MKNTSIATLLGLLIASPVMAATPDPCMPNLAEGAYGGGFPGTILTADFDGDGFEDRACALMAELDSEGPVNIDIEFGPFNENGIPLGGVSTLAEYNNRAEFGDKTLYLIGPGVYPSLCTKGYMECMPGDEAATYVNNPSIATGTEGASWMYKYIGRDPDKPDERLFTSFFLSD